MARYKPYFGISIFVFLLTATDLNSSAALGDPAATQPADRQGIVQVNTPYCGIYSLYAAALVEGHPISFEKMARKEYVGCSLGSSLAELEKAATDDGLYAAPVANLTTSFLWQCPYPVILHVKADPASKVYTHYVLFLGVKNGDAAILDSGNPIVEMPPEQLRLIWDGMGLVVSDKPIADGKIFLSSRIDFAVTALLICCGLVFVRHFNFLGATDIGSSRLFSRRLFANSAGIIASAVIAAFVMNLFTDGGLLASGGTINQIVHSNIDLTLPKIDLVTAEHIHDQGRAVFIDARMSADYAAGHIDGAINIPVYYSPTDRLAALSAVPKDSSLVIYCQSKTCTYSRLVADSLSADGYAQMSLFEGGWQDWSQAHH